MGQREDSRFILAKEYPELGKSAEAFLRKTFETAHEESDDIKKEKTTYIISLINVAFAIISPVVWEEISLTTEETIENDAENDS
jgi:hypothetical protein